MQGFGKEERLLLVQIYHPVSHRLNYLQANRKAIGKALTKEDTMKKCSDYSDSFGEFEGKKEILASVRYLGSHHQGHLHMNYPRNQSGKTFAKADSTPRVEKGTC